MLDFPRRELHDEWQLLHIWQALPTLMEVYPGRLSHPGILFLGSPTSRLDLLRISAWDVSMAYMLYRDV